MFMATRADLLMYHPHMGLYGPRAVNAACPRWYSLTRPKIEEIKWTFTDALTHPLDIRLA